MCHGAARAETEFMEEEIARPAHVHRARGWRVAARASDFGSLNHLVHNEAVVVAKMLELHGEG